MKPSIYNTLTRRKDVLEPSGKVFGMYCCGPTVYGPAHIGNFRTFLAQDVLRRVLECSGLKVKHVRNITDVDDKTIRESRKLGVSLSEFTSKWTDKFHADCERLNMLPPTVEPKATEHIKEQLEMVSKLVDNGHAYVAGDGSVYFKISSDPEYGKLSGLDRENLATQSVNSAGDANLADEYERENVSDFALWKSRKPEDGENFWKSPWGEGRPGWHIECSVMSKKYLGEEIDIHAGGEDLVFPHHENEIAQSEACNDEKFANYWMHNAFLNIDNKKMSKSAGNFFTVREISEKYPLQVIRFFMLSAHYRSPLNFSDTLVEASKNGLERILTAIDHLREVIAAAPEGELNVEDQKNLEEANALKAKYEAAMEDDFNTADAIAAIFELVKLANVTAESGSKAYAQQLLDIIVQLCDILGIITEKKEELLDDDIEALIEERQAARKAKNFARADEIRDLLADKGIILEDTRAGVKWKRA